MVEFGQGFLDSFSPPFTFVGLRSLQHPLEEWVPAPEVSKRACRVRGGGDLGLFFFFWGGGGVGDPEGPNTHLDDQTPKTLNMLSHNLENAEP